METKKCKKCQEEINKKAKKCPKCGSNQGMPLILRIVIAFIVIAVLGSLISGGDNKEKKTNDIKEEKCYITLEEFNKIQNGMSYDEVKEIVGCEGTVNSDTEVGSIKMTIYSWYGKDGISNANVNIENGKLINKTQIGLS